MAGVMSDSSSTGTGWVEDPNAALTLHGSYYTEAGIFERERSEVFQRSWQYAAHRSQLANPGDFVTRKIMDQEVFLICDEAGQVRAFYNACAHRAHLLVEGAGQCEAIVCPYHAWRYGLDGRLRYARGLNADVARDVGLSEVRTDWLLDFVFVNLDEAALPLSEVAPGLADDVAARAPFISSLKPVPDPTRVIRELDANWKVVVDNYIECYHCAPAHPGVSEVFDVARTDIELLGRAARQLVPRHQQSPVPEYPLTDEDDIVDGVFWFLYPNTSLSIIPGSATFTVTQIQPITAETCGRTFWSFTPDGTTSEAHKLRAAWLGRTVGAEDIALCEAVQRGLRQRGYGTGRYVAAAQDADEKALHAFHYHYLADMQGN